MCATPAKFIRALVEGVGGALACEGVDGSCGPTALGFLAGIAAILAVTLALGRSLNRVIEAIKDER